MAEKQTFVIVGGGLAGAKAAETLRDEGFDGRVVLIGDEPARPYERPPLSKEYLRGEKSFSESAAVHDEDFYSEHQIELRTLTTVTGLDVAGATVTIDESEQLRFDRLLLATGSAARPLPVPGVELAGMHYLRTLADADALRAVFVPGARVVVIGTSWIGTEVAASAQQLGCEVTMVGPEQLPLVTVLGPEVATVYRDLHAAHGVKLLLGRSIGRIVGVEHADGVELEDGTVLEADVVVAGVGAVPRLELPKDAGLKVDGGVVVAATLESSAPGIFAAGDIANVPYPDGRRLRLEHWSAALNQGPLAAKNMLGAGEPYTKVPYFFSDQWDLGMEYRGYAPKWDKVVFRGDPASGEFLAFWLKGDPEGSRARVLAGMNANVWDQGDAITALIESGASVDVAALADPGVDLASLAGADG
jgi:3-phenylpropionate/trans-cinnamate dioxygenase ferredoxin reductase component